MAKVEVTTADIQNYIGCLIRCMQEDGDLALCALKCAKDIFLFTDGELEALKMDLQAKGLLDQSD